ncbi:MAG: glutamine synthetase type III [Bdellovibrio sp. CG11_big_fil_rev_8_21_14_0_20_39_38]|nr:MAG: glutamine synthetase type III [Bdellovibrio sp. CG11_big_fil_rev_8_21_14_0_20_39_38]
MSEFTTRNDARHTATHRKERKIDLPTDAKGNYLKVSQFFGECIFDYRTTDGIPENVRKEIIDCVTTAKPVRREHAEVIAKAAVEWATANGATHFCHWFQPLTGTTAEKHDAFISFKNGRPIDHLSAGQLMQGEPDASSFPHGGSRSTFEARGYTTWDLSSPMFLMEGVNGKTLCIPTAFISYHGNALDMKTPLLRSINKLSEHATKFLHLIGDKKVSSVKVNCGPEQEYFLVDKAFYYSRPDLVMTGRALFGSVSSKNQQLSDHYFAQIPERVLSFMQELDLELYRVGITAKTRHNEVAPGQYEIAPLFSEANVSSDQNQLLMAIMRKTAEKHSFVAILHEKPFAGINGSGKHLNWSISTDDGSNLLEPGDEPHQNLRFMAVVAIICEAVKRHGGMMRASIASHSNDHRLGGHEAPPSIISVFLGDTLGEIMASIVSGKTFKPTDDNTLDIGAKQLAQLLKDNTDRNRTSPFAFTGNKFEFRACGASANIGMPLAVLNAAVTDVFADAIEILEKDLAAGKKSDDALMDLTKKLMTNSINVVFNGDGYSDEWIAEAQKRGLPNFRNSADAFTMFNDTKAREFMVKHKIYRETELDTRYNVLLDNYNTAREIEFYTMNTMVHQNIIPSAINYKLKLGDVLTKQKAIGVESSTELDLYKRVNYALESLYDSNRNMMNELSALPEDNQKKAHKIAHDLVGKLDEVAKFANELEEVIPDDMWDLPKYYDMLFLR